MIEVNLPLKIISVANAREYHYDRARRHRLHRRTAWLAMLSAMSTPPKPPLTIRLTRIGPRLLDSDNLASGFKAVRDGIADWLKVDDGSADLTWQYAQKSQGPGKYGASVEIFSPGEI